MRLLDQSVVLPFDKTRAIGEACREAYVVISIGVNARGSGTIYNFCSTTMGR